jgi:hypothetical protein
VVGHKHAAGLHPDDDGIGKISMIFDYLVTQSFYSDVELLLVENSLHLYFLIKVRESSQSLRNKKYRQKFQFSQ